MIAAGATVVPTNCRFRLLTVFEKTSDSAGSPSELGDLPPPVAGHQPDFRTYASFCRVISNP